MKKCPNCSLNLDDSVVKCSQCGYDFNENAENTVVLDAEAPVENSYATVNNQQTPPPYNPYGAPQHKFCPRCGNPCDPNAVICVKCGMSFGPNPQQLVDDNPSTLLKVVCFFVPLVALILYLVNKDKKPVSAKAYGKWGLIGLAVNIGLSILSSVLSAVLGLAAMDSVYNDPYYYYQILANLLH